MSVLTADAYRQYVIQNLEDPPAILRMTIRLLSLGAVDGATARLGLSLVQGRGDVANACVLDICSQIISRIWLKERKRKTDLGRSFAAESAMILRLSIDPSTSGSSEDQETSNEASVDQFNTGFLRSALTQIVRYLRYAENSDAAGYVVRNWSALEAYFRSISSSVILGGDCFNRIGHIVLTVSMMAAQRRGQLDDKPLFRHAALVSDNPYLAELVGGGLPIAEDHDISSSKDNYLQSVKGECFFVTSEKRLASLGQFISDNLDWHWQSSSTPPVTIDAKTIADGAEALTRHGIDPRGRIAIVHVRHSANQEKDRLTRSRSAEIGSYAPALAWLVAQGIQVIRMGDASMDAHEQDGVFDYARSAIKSDWMDVYLASICELCVGTSSGMSHVPHLFNKKILYTNWMPYGEYVYSRKSLILPKKVMTIGGETVDPAVAHGKYRNIYDSDYFTMHGTTIVDNSPEEILNAVIDIVSLDDDAMGRRDLRVRFAPSFLKAVAAEQGRQRASSAD